MTETNITINAQVREPSAKPSALRAGKIIPAVLYNSKGESLSLSVPVSELPPQHTRSKLIRLVAGSESKNVVMREVQVNPLNDQPIHIDFQEVGGADNIRIHIPLKFVGITREQEKEGRFDVQVRYLEVKGPWDKIPAEIEVDVGHLKAGDSIKVRDVIVDPALTVRSGRGANIPLATLTKS